MLLTLPQLFCLEENWMKYEEGPKLECQNSSLLEGKKHFFPLTFIYLGSFLLFTTRYLRGNNSFPSVHVFASSFLNLVQAALISVQPHPQIFLLSLLFGWFCFFFPRQPLSFGQLSVLVPVLLHLLSSFWDTDVFSPG